MRFDRSFVLVGAAAIVAFAAGRVDLPASSEANAAPQSARQDAQAPPEMNEKMMAAMKLGQPGEHHQTLEKLAGTWDASFKMWEGPDAQPMQMQGTIERAWVLDGHYMQETVEAQTPMGTFQGMGYIGYSNIDGQYQVAWMDSMSTHIMTGTGTYNPRTKVFSFSSDHRDPVSGKVMNVRSTLDLNSTDRHVYTDYVTGADGIEYKMFEGVAERR